jgi:WD40 repeat protein
MIWQLNADCMKCGSLRTAPDVLQAVTSTVDGDVIIWEQESMSAPVTAQQAQSSGSRRTLKIIRLHGAAIKHLSSIGNFVVTGGADGLVRMFDGGMRLCAWFESMDAGPITCVSFATKGQQHPTATMHLSRCARARGLFKLP